MFFSSQEALIQHLISWGILQNPKIIIAFQQIDRADFVLEDQINESYNDSPLPIGFGQTISQPSTVAFMLELLDVKSGNTILDIGSGSWWTTAMLAVLSWDTGYVIGLEIIPDLVIFGQRNITKYHFPNARIIPAKRDYLGIPGNKFDKILVSASAKIFPQELLNQLNPGGRLVIPIEHSIFLYKKGLNGEIQNEEFYGFTFVPLKTPS